jgi:hypothetical protein
MAQTKWKIFKFFARADVGRQIAHEVKEYLSHRFFTGLGRLLLKVNFFKTPSLLDIMFLFTVR